MTWKRQMEEDTNKIGLKKKDASDRAKWCDDVYNKMNPSTYINADKTGF